METYRKIRILGRTFTLFNFESPTAFSEESKLSEHGGVAQLGEHLPCKQGVRSSILLISTKSEEKRTRTPAKE